MQAKLFWTSKLFGRQVGQLSAFLILMQAEFFRQVSFLVVK